VAQGHGHRAFLHGRFVKVIGSASVMAEGILPPETLRRDRLDDENLRLATMREAIRDEGPQES
jgi:hypothetical protein